MRQGSPQDCTETSWKWNQYYLCGAVSLNGEALAFVMWRTLLALPIFFDSSGFAGVHLATDDNVLPPNLAWMRAQNSRV